MVYLAFDTETTGITEKCNVLTVHFIILDENLVELGSKGFKVIYPYYHVYPKALEINGIDLLKHNKDGVSVEKVNEELYEFLIQYPAYTALGHNIDFDIRMLEANNIKIKQYLESPNVDTLDICQKFKSSGIISKNQSLSLSKICYFYSIQVEDAELHTAEYDIRLTIELYKELLSQI